NGWIIGDPDTNGIALDSALAEGDLSARKAFDAIRARFDYNPLILDIIYAKVAENNTTLNDDTTLTGINAGYELSANTNIEGFFFSKIRGVTGTNGVIAVDTAATTSFDTVKQSADVVNTIGTRVVNKSIKNLALDAQVAYQFGTYNPKLDPNARFISATDKAETSPRSAWGAEVVATYDLKDVAAISKYEPTLTGVYVYLSGDSRDKTGNKAYTGWDGMFENQSFGHIINAIMGFSNTHLAGLSLKGKPATDLTAKVDYISGWFAKRYPEGRAAILSGVSTARQFTMGKNPYFGHELDVTLTYDYTEDVQMSLLGGIFMPSKAINERSANDPFRQRANAAELIGSMKVTF
ncbi:MAG TPA: alginate export family protein, partial [Candidatus Omnitrophota bacterium]|nr:alginate export family protein [Candidatus Omnitrophota bacterium]